MAMIFFAKDGKRPRTQKGGGLDASIDQVGALVGQHELMYCGLEAPSINPDQLSHTEKNVVIFVSREDQVTTLFPKRGYYHVIGLSPAEAEQRLQALGVNGE